MFLRGVGVAGILPPTLVELLMYVGGAKLDAVSAGAVLQTAAYSGSTGWCAPCAQARMISLPMPLRPFILHPEAHPAPRHVACSRCLRPTVGVLAPLTVLDVLAVIWRWTP